MQSLTEVAVRGAKPREKPYKLFDGGGLYLLVQPTGARLWRFKYRVEGREKLLAFGAWPDTGLKDVRLRRDDARRLVAAGVDPSAKRKAERIANAQSFAAVADEWQERRRGKITDSTYSKARWLLEEMLGPHIGSRPVAALKAADVLAALRRVEARGKHETAHRARQIASQVFRYAVATGRAERDPTTDLRGALAPVKTQNRAAITDPAKIGALLRALHSYDGQATVGAALKLAPLLFARPGEMRYARWEEFDLDGAQWRIPAERMKMREQHLVPLSPQAVGILRTLHVGTGPSGYLFPSLRTPSRPISENTLNAALRRLGYGKDEMTAHGFRAMASTSLNEQGFPCDVIELQLAHKERNQVRSAYNRSQRLQERQKMMQHWANYLDGLRAGATVTAIGRAVA